MKNHSMRRALLLSFALLFLFVGCGAASAEARSAQEIIEERKNEKIDEVYAQWMADEKFETDSQKLGEILKERSYTAPVVPETEGDTGTSSIVETELQMEVTYETEITVETESEE